ncbi:MAG: competence/damage-inducible protein A [Clostridiales bacterium]|nr:competence/damage-inducible protein A [Clostridiales bacterium]
MKAAIFTIGNEVLSGKTLNTNSQFLSSQLQNLGVEVIEHVTVEDQETKIISTIQRLSKEVEIIITTGGLGPTYDDITFSSIAKSLNIELVLFEEVLSDIKMKFSKFGSHMGENNISQARLPEGSIVIKNQYGTAPGIFLKQGDLQLIALPGPPKENIPMFTESVMPLIKSMGNGQIHIKDIVIFGVGESKVENILNEKIKLLDKIRIATYVKPRYVIVRLTSKDSNKIDIYQKIICDIFNENIVGYDDSTLEDEVVNLLKNKQLKLSLAESCTGGMVSSLIVDVPGSSSVLERSIVTYSNRSKIDELNVNQESLYKYGAVSETVANEMATGLFEKTHSDVCVSITGIAGPDGGTDEKPVGLVFIAIKTLKEIKVHQFNFFGDRNNIRHRAALNALNLIRLELIKDSIVN